MESVICFETEENLRHVNERSFFVSAEKAGGVLQGIIVGLLSSEHLSKSDLSNGERKPCQNTFIVHFQLNIFQTDVSVISAVDGTGGN